MNNYKTAYVHSFEANLEGYHLRFVLDKLFYNIPYIKIDYNSKTVLYNVLIKQNLIFQILVLGKNKRDVLQCSTISPTSAWNNFSASIQDL